MVNGKRLEKSVLILVRNVRLPVKERCILRGYELGEMIGSPPALREAAEEQGDKYEERSSAVWRWRPYFVVLTAGFGPSPNLYLRWGESRWRGLKLST